MDESFLSTPQTLRSVRGMPESYLSTPQTLRSVRACHAVQDTCNAFVDCFALLPSYDPKPHLLTLRPCPHPTRLCTQVMGMLQGRTVQDTFVVIDCFALPVEGTETRVNAQAEAYEYMVDFIDTNKVWGGGAALWEGVGGARSDLLRCGGGARSVV